MQLDLNLLTALDALIEEASVTAAAQRLHLSAPAMSRTLGRIRKATGDQILVRTGRTMTRTPYALEVREQVRDIVHQAESVLAPDRALDLDTLNRIFTLQCHDAITTAIGPGLLAAIQASAPGVQLRLLAEASTDTNDLRRGHVDMELGSTVPTLPEIRYETPVNDDLVIAVAPGHPLTEGEITVERYAKALHVTVSRRGRLRDPIDDALAELGLTRKIVAAAPTSTAALSIVSQGTFVVVVPERTCAQMIRAIGLRTIALPLERPQVPIVCAWHQRYENDKAHVWLRHRVRSALRDICGPDKVRQAEKSS
jgi:DNA-binding transcriptional LysR family regulator